eukprot:4277715-Karenia_brevis.AAC.1
MQWRNVDHAEPRAEEKGERESHYKLHTANIIKHSQKSALKDPHMTHMVDKKGHRNAKYGPYGISILRK